MKSVLLHGALALIGLVLAYRTYTRPPEDEAPKAARVTIAECAASELREVRMQTPTHYIAAKAEGEGAERAQWITTRRKTDAEVDGKEKSPSADGTAKPQGAEAQPDKHFAPDFGDPSKARRTLGNEAFGDYLKRLTPLTAERSLGVLPAAKLKEFGFADVGTRMEVLCGDRALQLEVGERTYGTGQRYVRDQSTKVVYLVDDTLVTDLQSSQFKFLQSSPHRFTLSEIDELTVEAKGREKKLLQRDRKVSDKAMWVDASAPTTRNELYGNWLSRVERLRIRDYLARGQEPGSDIQGAAGQVTSVVALRYISDGKPLGNLELVRVDAGAATRYYARSETTGVWVSVFDTTAKDIEQDVGMVVGVDEAKTAAPASAARSNDQAAEPPRP